MVLVTDGRYGDQATAQLAQAGVDGRVMVGLSERGDLRHARCGGRRVALGRLRGRARHATSSSNASKASVRDVSSSRSAASSRPSGGAKDPGEIARMAEACRIADAALSEIGTAVGGSHRGRGPQPAGDPHARARCRRTRATRRSSRPGPVNAARPHHRPTDTLIEAGHTVIIDVGALYDGYHSDMTRTFFVGEPTPQQRRCTRSCWPRSAPAWRPSRRASARAELDARVPRRHHRGRLRRVVQPRHRSRRRAVDPRGPVHQSHRRPQIAGRGRSDRGAWGLS